MREPHADGTRTVFFDSNGQPRKLTIRDEALKPQVESLPNAHPAKPGNVGSPIPGFGLDERESAGLEALTFYGARGDGDAARRLCAGGVGKFVR